jgi:hypothetical protein
MVPIERLCKVERELTRVAWTFCGAGVFMVVVAVVAWWFGRSTHLWLLPGSIAVIAGGIAWGHAGRLKESIAEILNQQRSNAALNTDARQERPRAG